MKYKFNGEEHFTSKAEKDKVEKEKVEFKENKTEAIAAFGILENMHTEASDYIYRNLKELMIDLKYFASSELTDDLQNMLLWPIKTDNQNTTWDTSMDEKKFGTTIKCEDGETDVVSPSEAKIEKIEGNSITLEFKNMSDESYELLEYICEYKDPYKKVNRELVTGMKLKIDDIKVSGVKAGQSVKRGQKLGTAEGLTDQKASITYTMYNLDKSIVEDTTIYFRQEENTKYEELMKIKKETPEKYEEGLDISSVLYGGLFGAGGGSDGGAATAPGNVQDFVNKALSVVGANYIGSGYIWTGNVATSYFTCSGLVDFALGNAPRTTWPESEYETIKSKGRLVQDISQLKYGDLLFYTYAGRYPGHVAIYLGDNKRVHANGSEVAIDDRAVTGNGAFIGGGSYLN